VPLVLYFEVDVTVAFLDLLIGNLSDEFFANVVAQILHSLLYRIIIY